MSTESVSLSEPVQEQPVARVTLCAVCEKRIVYLINHLTVRREGMDYAVCSPECAEGLRNAPVVPSTGERSLRTALAAEAQAWKREV